MKAQRRDQQSIQPSNGGVKNAMTSMKGGKTSPAGMANTVSTAKDACYANVGNTVNNRKA